MEIRIRATGAVVTEQEFRSMNTNMSLPAVLSAELLDQLGADPVLEGPQFTGGNQYQYSQRAGVEEINGQWFTKYVAGPVFQDTTNEDGTVVTAAEQEAQYKARIDANRATSVRAERNMKLAATDWTQARDVVLPNDAEWAAYRQALRDISSQPGFPWTVEWPVQPV